RARRRERLRLLNLALDLLARHHERTALVRTGALEVAPGGEQLAAEDRLLLGPRVDHVRLLADAAAHPRRLLPRHLHLPPRRRDLGRDPLVLRGDRSEIVELVEDVVEAACGEQDVDRRRLVLLVDVDQSQVETPHRQPVLVLEITESDRLKAEELIQLVEPALVQREIRLERRELRRDITDAT